MSPVPPAPPETASKGWFGKLRRWADERGISAGKLGAWADARRASAGGWAAKNPLPAVTIAGLAAYGLVRFSLTRFYSRFGIDPEDVGLGYTETLSRAFIGVAWLVLVTVFFTVLIYLVLLARRLTGLPNERKRTFIQRGLVVGTLAAIGAALFIPLSAELLAVEAQHGRSISPNDRNPLAIRAPRVDVTWKGTRPQAIRHCGCVLLYLGRANGLAVFYDSTRNRTLRIPESDLQFSLKRNKPGWFSNLVDWMLWGG